MLPFRTRALVAALANRACYPTRRYARIRHPQYVAFVMVLHGALRTQLRNRPPMA